MSVHTFPDKNAAILALANRIDDVANMSIHSNDKFSIVLSGGSTPQQLYQTLAEPPFRDSIPWSKVFFFLGDERYVPLTDDESNYKMIEESLLKPLNISDNQVFKYNTNLPPEKAALEYQQYIQQYFKNDKARFDMVLLGLGDNAHTASLFPNTNILSDKTPAVKSVIIKEPDTYRLTLNAPMINQAIHIAFLVTGQPKAMAVHQVLEGKEDCALYPAQLIRTELVDWYIDEAAGNFL